jgi:uncharacterized membrane protein YjgN (DUF898 family)
VMKKSNNWNGRGESVEDLVPMKSSSYAGEGKAKINFNWCRSCHSLSIFSISLVILVATGFCLNDDVFWSAFKTNVNGIVTITGLGLTVMSTTDINGNKQTTNYNDIDNAIGTNCAMVIGGALALTILAIMAAIIFTVFYFLIVSGFEYGTRYNSIWKDGRRQFIILQVLNVFGLVAQFIALVESGAAPTCVPKLLTEVQAAAKLNGGSATQEAGGSQLLNVLLLILRIIVSVMLHKQFKGQDTRESARL